MELLLQFKSKLLPEDRVNVLLKIHRTSALLTPLPSVVRASNT